MDYKTMFENTARLLGAHVQYSEQTMFDAYSEVAPRKVAMPVWRGDETDHYQYWVGMHELGHIATSPANFMPNLEVMFGNTEKVIDIEATAWDWALDNSPIPFDKAGDTIARAAMGSYSQDLGSDGSDITARFKERLSGPFDKRLGSHLAGFPG
jgi:hypothetical protein